MFSYKLKTKKHIQQFNSYCWCSKITIFEIRTFQQDNFIDNKVTLLSKDNL